MDVTIIISYFGGSNNIFADCICIVSRSEENLFVEGYVLKLIFYSRVRVSWGQLENFKCVDYFQIEYYEKGNMSSVQVVIHNLYLLNL